MTRIEKALMLLRDLSTTRRTGDRYQGDMVDLMLTELDDEAGYQRGLDRLFGGDTYYLSRRQKRALKP